MIEEEINVIAGKLSDLLPLFIRKLMRPFELKTRDLTSPLQMYVMLILSEKEMSTLTELADEMNMSKQQMTPIINKLHDNGFVQREQDNIDRRSVNLRLTSAGVDLLGNRCQEVNLLMKRKIEGLDKDDLQTLLHALNDLFRIIQKIAP